MGIFDGIKKAFDSGGIKVKLETPNSFTWSDGSIPVTVTLTGHKTEPRTVTDLRFTLEEVLEESGSGSSGISNRRGASMTFNRSEPIQLQPLQEVSVNVDIPLAVGGEATGVLGMAGKVLDVLGAISADANDYELSVHTRVEGAKAEKGTSRRIRNGAVGFRTSITLGG